MKKIISFLVLVTFIVSCIMPPRGFAQSLTAMGLMSQPGVPVALSAAFTPAQLWGMSIHPNEPFNFDFLVQKGDARFTDTQKQEEYAKLIKYFLAALAVPDTDQWVNLSPYEQERIIPENFGLTDMGRDVLAQDYLLKQLSSSLTNPDTDLGKKFWDGVYARSYERFGTTDVPTDTFNKVWIMPDKAVVYEKDSTVYVLESHLKVLTDKDYLANKSNVVSGSSSESNTMADISSQVIKEVIIPALEKEVNEGRGFAPLRQIYSGMLLATWYKRTLKESILGKVYADRGKVKGVDQDPKANHEIYDQYVAAFKKGVFNMIKEDVDQYTQELIPRKYFSGGFIKPTVENAMIAEKDVNKAQATIVSKVKSGVERVKSVFQQVKNALKFDASQEDAVISRGQAPDFVRDANMIRNGLWHFLEIFPEYEMRNGQNISGLLRSTILSYTKEVDNLMKNFPDLFKSDAQAGKELWDIVQDLWLADVWKIGKQVYSYSTVKIAMKKAKGLLKGLDFDVQISLQDKDYSLIEALTDVLFFNTVSGVLGSFDFTDINAIKGKIADYVSDGQKGQATPEINQGIKNVGALSDQTLETYAKIIRSYVVSQRFTEQLLAGAQERQRQMPGNSLKTTSGLTRDKVEQIVSQLNGGNNESSIKSSEDVQAWIQSKQYKLLNSLLVNLGANRGFRMCGPASIVVSRILADLSGLPVGLRLTGDHIELQVNIYDNGDPEQTEEHTYIKMYLDGKIIYIDPVLNVLTGKGAGIEVQVFDGESQEKNFKEYLDKVRHLHPFDHNNKGIAQRGTFQGFSSEEIREGYEVSMDRINSEQWYLPSKSFLLKGTMSKLAVIQSDEIGRVFDIFENFFKNGSSRKNELDFLRLNVYQNLAIEISGNSLFGGFAWKKGLPDFMDNEDVPFEVSSIMFDPSNKESPLNYKEAMTELKRILAGNKEALARLGAADKHIAGLISFSEREARLQGVGLDKQLKDALDNVAKGLRTFNQHIYANNTRMNNGWDPAQSGPRVEAEKILAQPAEGWKRHLKQVAIEEIFDENAKIFNDEKLLTVMPESAKAKILETQGSILREYKERLEAAGVVPAVSDLFDVIPVAWSVLDGNVDFELVIKLDLQDKEQTQLEHDRLKSSLENLKERKLAFDNYGQGVPESLNRSYEQIQEDINKLTQELKFYFGSLDGVNGDSLVVYNPYAQQKNYGELRGRINALEVAIDAVKNQIDAAMFNPDNAQNVTLNDGTEIAEPVATAILGFIAENPGADAPFLNAGLSRIATQLAGVNSDWFVQAQKLVFEAVKVAGDQASIQFPLKKPVDGKITFYAKARESIESAAERIVRLRSLPGSPDLMLDHMNAQIVIYQDTDVPRIVYLWGLLNGRHVMNAPGFQVGGVLFNEFALSATTQVEMFKLEIPYDTSPNLINITPLSDLVGFLGDNSEAVIAPGGIDLAQANLDLQIKRDGKGMVLPVNQQDLENIRIDGLVPVILDIQPVTHMTVLN